MLLLGAGRQVVWGSSGALMEGMTEGTRSMCSAGTGRGFNLLRYSFPRCLSAAPPPPATRRQALAIGALGAVGVAVLPLLAVACVMAPTCMPWSLAGNCTACRELAPNHMFLHCFYLYLQSDIAWLLAHKPRLQVRSGRRTSHAGGH